MSKTSAGILLYKTEQSKLYFLLVHPGGPFFKKKDAGWWTIPKGEPEALEDALIAALREFEEETGYQPAGPYIPLTTITQKGGKKVQCWAAYGDLDPEKLVSNVFELEWPPRSGQRKSFPEIDQAAWFTLEEARAKINERQIPLLEELAAKL